MFPSPLILRLSPFRAVSFDARLVWVCFWHASCIGVLVRCTVCHFRLSRLTFRAPRLDYLECNSLATSSAVFGNASASILTERWRGYTWQAVRLCRNEIEYRGVMARWHVCHRYEGQKIRTKRDCHFEVCTSLKVLEQLERALAKVKQKLRNLCDISFYLVRKSGQYLLEKYEIFINVLTQKLKMS